MLLLSGLCYAVLNQTVETGCIHTGCSELDVTRDYLGKLEI